MINIVRTSLKSIGSLCSSTDTDSVSFLLLSAGAGVRYQIHGDQCKGEHQCGECKSHFFCYYSFIAERIIARSGRPCTFIPLTIRRGTDCCPCFCLLKFSVIISCSDF